MKYKSNFVSNDILTLLDLKDVSSADLKDIGVTVGNKNKIMKALENMKQGDHGQQPNDALDATLHLQQSQTGSFGITASK